MKHSNNKEKFLDQVCELVRVKKMHKQIRKELNDHIEDQRDEYILRGMDKDEALIKSIEDMGDPLLVGKELNEAHKPLVEWSVLITTGLFLLISGIMQYMFSNIESISANSQAVFFSKFLVYAPIGIMIFAVAYFFDYTLLRKYAWILYISYILLMIVIFMTSPMVYGSIFYAYYPSLLFIPIFSGIVYRLSHMKYLGILLSGIVCMPAFIIALGIPSISNTLILIISCLVILTSAIKGGLFRCDTKLGLSLVYIPTIITFISSIFIMIVQSPYRFNRLLSLFIWTQDANAEDYQMAIVRETIRNSRPFGSISIKNKPLEALLPGWNSDFSFTFLIGKLGYIPAIIVGALILFLLYRLYRISLSQKNILGKLLSLGCVSILTLQFVCSILFNIGFYIIITQAPPFLSYGSLSLVFTMGLLGLILSVYRRSNIVANTSLSPVLKNDIIYIDDGKLIVNFKNKWFKKQNL